MGIWHGNEEGNEGEEKQELRQVGGAAVAGGIAGLMLIGGPIAALVAAGGAAVAATTPGRVGEVTRSTVGEATATAGEGIHGFCEKHDVVGKTRAGLVTAGNQLKDFDKKHQVTTKAMKGMKDLFTSSSS